VVLETDAPDIPPHWLYVTAAERAAGHPQGINGPSQLPRIAAVMVELRATTPEALMRQTSVNAQQALPKLAACWGG
jgi:TatD DNase family protein